MAGWVLLIYSQTSSCPPAPSIFATINTASTTSLHMPALWHDTLEEVVSTIIAILIIWWMMHTWWIWWWFTQLVDNANATLSTTSTLQLLVWFTTTGQHFQLCLTLIEFGMVFHLHCNTVIMPRNTSCNTLNLWMQLRNIRQLLLLPALFALFTLYLQLIILCYWLELIARIEVILFCVNWIQQQL